MYLNNIFSELSFEIIAAITLTLLIFILKFSLSYYRNRKERSNVIQSPDRKKICFETTRNGNRDIYVVDVEKNVTIPLVTHPADDESPVWSPDSSRIAFVSDRRGTRNIYIINWNGTGLIELTNDNDDNHTPIWSSDSNKIIYTARRNGKSMIKIINVKNWARSPEYTSINMVE